MEGKKEEKAPLIQTSVVSDPPTRSTATLTKVR